MNEQPVSEFPLKLTEYTTVTVSNKHIISSL